MSYPAVSIVILVYNQQKYVGKCIRSVLSQSFRNFEIILVNDGSTDSSLRICQKYARKDKRIFIVDKRNEKVAFARRDGLLKAKGKYICFIDSDDYLANGALNTLFTLAENTGADMVVGNFDKVFDNWGLLKKKASPFPYAERLIEKHELIPLMIGLGDYRKTSLWGVLVWGRLYRRDSVMRAYEADQDLLFPSSKEVVSEDASFNLAMAPYMDSIWISNTIVCHYRYGGATSGDFPYVRKGGSIYDDRYDRCFAYGCQQVLPQLFGRYVVHLQLDVLNQIHFHSSSEKELYAFMCQEFRDRKVTRWARNNAISLNSNDMLDTLLRNVIDDNPMEFLRIIHLREDSLRAHYRKMKMAKLYQRLADMIGGLWG